MIKTWFQFGTYNTFTNFEIKIIFSDFRTKPIFEYMLKLYESWESIVLKIRGITPAVSYLLHILPEVSKNFKTNQYVRYGCIPKKKDRQYFGNKWTTMVLNRSPESTDF